MDFEDLGPVPWRELLASVARNVARTFLLELGVDPSTIIGGRPPAPVPPAAPDPHAVLQVSPRAPREVVEAAYRALAKLHHPDQGGDPERMKVLTAAMDRIRKLHGWR